MSFVTRSLSIGRDTARFVVVSPNYHRHSPCPPNFTFVLSFVLARRCDVIGRVALRHTRIAIRLRASNSSIAVVVTWFVQTHSVFCRLVLTISNSFSFFLFYLILVDAATSTAQWLLAIASAAGAARLAAKVKIIISNNNNETYNNSNL